MADSKTFFKSLHNKSKKPAVLILAVFIMLFFFIMGNLANSDFFWRSVLTDNNQRILLCHIPFSAASEQEEGIFASFWHNISSPDYFFSASAGAFAQSLPNTMTSNDSQPPLAAASAPLIEEAKKEQTKPLTSEPLIGIYCTHSAESYIPTSGQSSTSGKNGGVYQVAKSIQAALAEKGINAVVCDTIHDYPNWKLSYQNSLASMKTLKGKYPSIEMFIDVHRDSAIENISTVTKIDGEKVARLMLVVGSNQRLQHDNWKQNLAFAQRIGDLLDQQYPGLLRDVRVQSGRYNQHFSTKAILVEFGSTENTQEQAQKSAYLFADIVSQVLREAE